MWDGSCTPFAIADHGGYDEARTVAQVYCNAMSNTELVRECVVKDSPIDKGASAPPGHESEYVYACTCISGPPASPPPPPMPPSPPPSPSLPPPPWLPNAQLLTRGQFTLKETYFEGSHVVQDPEAAQETGEIYEIIREVIVQHGMSVHDFDLASIGIEGTTNQLAVTWSVVLTAPASNNWESLGTYVRSFAFTTALTSAATTAGSVQHTSSFFEAMGRLTTESLGVSNVPSPPPAAGAP
jgi:hypothetical protein